MSTAVATCMAHGLIPIITKECGFNDSPLIVQIDDFSIKNIKNVISIMMNQSIDEILEKRRECYNYARKEFSLVHFNNSFNKIMDSIKLKSK